MKKSFILVIILTILPISAQDGEVSKTPIALGSFKMGLIGQSTLVNKSNMADLENALYSNIRTNLFNTNKFDFVERKGLDSVVEELSLQYDSGLFNPEALPEWGLLQGARLLVMGTIVQFGIDDRSSRVGGLVGNSKRMLVMSVELRIIDIETAKLKLIEMIDAEMVLAKGTDLGFLRTPQASKMFGDDANLAARGSAFGSSSGELGVVMDLMRVVAGKCVREIVLLSNPIKIIRATNNGLYLNYGDTILQVGDILEVCGEGEPLIDPATGEVLAMEPISLGFARVTEVTKKYSVATLYQGDMAILTQRDDLYCKPKVEAPTTKKAKNKKKKGWNPFKKKKK